MTSGTTVQLLLSAKQAEILRDVAIAAYPCECCGLLVGEGETEITVCEIVPTANVADDPRRTFSIEPQAQFDLLRKVRNSGTGRRIVCHYHSHPDGAAIPSSHDLAMAYDPEAIWVVLAASAGKASAPKAFRHPFGLDGFVEVPVAILAQEDWA
jgi:proteasome lid subunit RPN8/RPN11